MTSISMRLELSTAQTVALLGILTEALAQQSAPYVPIYVGVNVYENARVSDGIGHTMRIQADAVSSGVNVKVHDVIVDGE